MLLFHVDAIHHTLKSIKFSRDENGTNGKNATGEKSWTRAKTVDYAHTQDVNLRNIVTFVWSQGLFFSHSV